MNLKLFFLSTKKFMAQSISPHWSPVIANAQDRCVPLVARETKDKSGKDTRPNPRVQMDAGYHPRH